MTTKKEGIFRCKICGSKAPYDFEKWQTKDDKWIFYTKDTESSLEAWIGHWKHSYEQYLERAVYDYPYDDSDYETISIWEDCFSDPNKCWTKTGGQSEEQWNIYYKNKYECSHCGFTAKSFKNFISSESE